jgi:hypothetical protein
MKLTNFKTALLALAGTTLLTTAAHAQYYSAGGSDNDLIVNFQESGVATDLQVDLGNISQFDGVTPTFTSINLNTDLANVFGSSYYTASGTSGTTGAGVYAADTDFVSDPSSTPFSTQNLTQTTALQSKISALYSPEQGSPAATAGLCSGGSHLHHER